MKKLWIYLVLAALLLTVPSCSKFSVEIKNTFENGLDYGNTLVAEQGDYLAMRGGKDDAPALFIYHKPSGESRYILSADVYQIALCDNTVFYKKTVNDCLYAYDLGEEDNHRILLEEALSYQVRDGMVYYLVSEHGKYINTYDLATGTVGKLETGYTVDSFALTEYGMYYSDDTAGVYLVLPWGETRDRIVAAETDHIFRDAHSIDGGADMVYLKVNNLTGDASVCVYRAAKNETKTLLTHTLDATADLENINVTRGKVVTLYNKTICAIDIETGETESWGAIKEDFQTEGVLPQIMSDCVIYYIEDEENTALKASIQYYPEEK